MSKEKVILYGASGYTGKQIAWQLAVRDIPFIAAGRDQVRLEQQMQSLPELKNARYSCSAVEHDEGALTELFTGAAVVCNVVGPFMQLSEPVVKAALNAGCHYIDTTGEQDWMIFLKDHYGQAFKEKNLLLGPATSWMWLGGQIAAEIALETPGIDSLDILYLADSNTSVASTKSFMRMLNKPQYYLEYNVMQPWPAATSYQVSVPGVHAVLNALPWSGGGEPVWYADDDRVQSCSVLAAFRNQAMIDVVIGLVHEFDEKYKDLPEKEQEQITNDMGSKLVSEEPEREEPAKNRSLVSCHGRGDHASNTVVVRGNCPYIQTAIFAAEASRMLLLNQHKTTGFTSPAVAFGARKLLSAAADCGHLTWNVTNV